MPEDSPSTFTAPEVSLRSSARKGGLDDALLVVVHVLRGERDPGSGAVNVPGEETGVVPSGIPCGRARLRRPLLPGLPALRHRGGEEIVEVPGSSAIGTGSSFARRRALWGGGWILLLAVYALAFQGRRGLWEPDEGRYVAAALEMERLDEYVVPHLHPEVVHLSKPPPTYWSLLAGLAMFGESEWGLRLPNALAYLATILAVGALARHLAPRAGAVGASLLYATMLLPAAASNIITTDTLLTLFETLAVLGFVGLRWGPRRQAELHRALLWLGFGLSFATKGPPGLLPLAAIVVFAWVAGSGGEGRFLVSVPGLLLFSVVGLWWYVAVAIRLPWALSYFLGHEVYARVITGIEDRNNEWWKAFTVYGPMLLGGTLPWTGLLLHRLPSPRLWWSRNAWSRLRFDDPKELFLVLWTLLPVLVLALSRSRMPLYVLPTMVPLALLAARQLDLDRWRSRRRLALVASWFLFVLVVRASAAYLPVGRDSRALAAAIASTASDSVSEVVFVETTPWYGLSFYLGVEVELVTIYPESVDRFGERYSDTLEDELAEPQRGRLGVVRRFHLQAFRNLAAHLGFEAVARGGWDDFDFVRLRPLQR